MQLDGGEDEPSGEEFYDAMTVDGAVPGDGATPIDPDDAGPILDSGPAPEPMTADDAGTGCVPSEEICNGRDDDCKDGADNGLLNACRGSVCGADLSLLSQKCTVGQGDCANSGVWECDPTAGNNALRCSVQQKPKNACNTSCGPVPVETCDGQDNDCDGTPDDGLLNACGGNVCGADLKDQGQGCSVDTGECVGSGTWKCDASKGNNSLRCEVSSRAPRNLAADASFEKQTSYSVMQPWSNLKGAFISSDAHTGTHGATVNCDKQSSTSVSGWNDINQVVAVIPNATYKLEAWVKTSPNFVYGRIGARDGTNWNEIAENLGYAFGALPQWTYVSTRFTMGASGTLAGLYIGGQDNNGAATTVTVDDVVVTRENACQ